MAYVKYTNDAHDQWWVKKQDKLDRKFLKENYVTDTKVNTLVKGKQQSILEWEEPSFQVARLLGFEGTRKWYFEKTGCKEVEKPSELAAFTRENPELAYNIRLALNSPQDGYSKWHYEGKMADAELATNGMIQNAVLLNQLTDIDFNEPEAGKFAKNLPRSKERMIGRIADMLDGIRIPQFNQEAEKAIYENYEETAEKNHRYLFSTEKNKPGFRHLSKNEKIGAANQIFKHVREEVVKQLKEEGVNKISSAEDAQKLQQKFKTEMNNILGVIKDITQFYESIGQFYYGTVKGPVCSAENIPGGVAGLAEVQGMKSALFGQESDKKPMTESKWANRIIQDSVKQYKGVA